MALAVCLNANRCKLINDNFFYCISHPLLNFNILKNLVQQVQREHDEAVVHGRGEATEGDRFHHQTTAPVDNVRVPGVGQQQIRPGTLQRARGGQDERYEAKSVIEKKIQRKKKGRENMAIRLCCGWTPLVVVFCFGWKMLSCYFNPLHVWRTCFWRGGCGFLFSFLYSWNRGWFTSDLGHTTVPLIACQHVKGVQALQSLFVSCWFLGLTFFLAPWHLVFSTNASLSFLFI